jgi:hypothetical protein
MQAELIEVFIAFVRVFVQFQLTRFRRVIFRLYSYSDRNGGR